MTASRVISARALYVMISAGFLLGAFAMLVPHSFFTPVAGFLILVGFSSFVVRSFHESEPSRPKVWIVGAMQLMVLLGWTVWGGQDLAIATTAHEEMDDRLVALFLAGLANIFSALLLASRVRWDVRRFLIIVSFFPLVLGFNGVIDDTTFTHSWDFPLAARALLALHFLLLSWAIGIGHWKVLFSRGEPVA